MDRRIARAATAALLAALAIACSSASTPPAESAGCKKDSDCKGARICVSGVCTDYDGGASDATVSEGGGPDARDAADGMVPDVAVSDTGSDAAGCGAGGTHCSGPCVAGSCQSVTAISGGNTTCALLSGGTVECWGDNRFGEIGNGSSTGPDTCDISGRGFSCSTTPVAVSGLSGVTAISTGSGFACALLSGGTVECWGDNAVGELGNGSSTGPDTCAITGYIPNPCSTTPVFVSGLSGVTAISAGTGSACALLSGGTVECWGANEYGQIGNGTTTTSSPYAVPTPVGVSGLSGVTAISAGDSFACALLSGGTVECWGENQYGELGNGSSTGPDTCAISGEGTNPCSTTPVAVSGLSGVTAISTGGFSACALLSGGTVECWGANPTGPDTCAISGGTNPCSTTPVAVSGLSGVTAISTGGDGVCALLSGGTVQCLGGDNTVGELGNGTTTNSSTPVDVSGLSGVTAISAGGDSTCALLSGGTVECWGENQYGELGNGTTTGPQTCGAFACSTTPVALVNAPDAYVGQLAPPTFTPPSGTTLTGTTDVTIVPPAGFPASGFIYYTTNGTNPNPNSLVYAGPIAVSQAETIRAYAYAPGYADSPIVFATYTVN